MMSLWQCFSFLLTVIIKMIILIPVIIMYCLHCSRSKDIVEPLIKPQWYVDCQEMAAMAVKVHYSILHL